ncbi:DNA -binding domain-containing protein [Burkholderia sp. PR2]
MNEFMARSADWCNPADYPDESFSPDRWAWEFLRRNDDYRRELDSLRNADEAAYQAHLARWHVACYWTDEFMAREGLDAPCSFRPAVDGARRLRGPLAVRLAGDLGARAESVFVHPARDDSMAFVIDLSAPLEQQIESIHLAAAARQASLGIEPVSPRAQMEKYARYLRAFDASNAGASAKKIADLLSGELKDPDDSISGKTVGNWIKSARELIAGGYVDVPRLTKNAAEKRGYLKEK